MTHKIATFISAILHPLLMPTYLFIIILFIFPDNFNLVHLSYKNILNIITLIFVTTAALPAASVLFLKSMNFVSDINLNKRRERILPYVFTLCLYTTISYMLYKQGKVEIFLVILTSGTLLVILSFLTNFFIKISAHAAGISALVGYLFALTYQFGQTTHIYILSASIILAGTVASSRLALHVHTPKQILLGTILGFLIGFFSIYIII